MKNKLLIILFIVAIMVVIIGGKVYAQMSGYGFSSANLWKLNDTILSPQNTSWTLGTSTSRIAKGWFADLDASTSTIGSLTISTSIGTGFTDGSVLFATSSGIISQDNSNFFYDAINHRLGLGTITPQFTLDSTGVVQGRIKERTQALSASTSVNWDLSLGGFATLSMLQGATTTLGNPTNMMAGGSYSLIVTQNNTTSSPLLFGNVYRFSGKSTPTLTMTTSSVDIFTFISDGTYMYGSAQNNF